MSMIKPCEHVFICGATGSGKTVLTKLYTHAYENIFVLDVKGTFTFKPFLTDKKFTIVDKI